MIVVDTNVVSEPLKPKAETRVENWLDAQAADDLFFTSVGMAELLGGIELLPDGKRKQGLLTKLDDIAGRLFAGRVLSFDTDAAVMMAKINKLAVQTGYNVTFADGQIGAIAAVRNFAVATRDEGPFRAMGLTVINPWTA